MHATLETNIRNFFDIDAFTHKRMQHELMRTKPPNRFNAFENTKISIEITNIIIN